MPKLKMLSLPKKPKKSAALVVKQRYVAKVQAIKMENTKRNKINNESKRLDKVIAGISGATVRPSAFSVKFIRNKKSSAPRKRHTRTAKRKKR